MKINFSVIIPNYNGSKFITPCLLALDKSINKCKDSKFEVIFVDNGSTDNSLEIARKHNYKIIKNKQNLGFSKAVNLGINNSTYQYVCILNNDLTLKEDWFCLISQNIQKFPEVTTFCGTVLNHNGTTIESQGFKYYMSGKCENINNGNPFFRSKILKQKNIFVWGTSAAVVVYNKKTIQNIGLFDESFFAYIEDVDLSFRLAKKGHQTLLIPPALSNHLGGQTSSQMGNFRAKNTLKNWIKLIHKNYSFAEFISYFPGIFIERLRNLSYYLRCSFIIKSV